MGTPTTLGNYVQGWYTQNIKDVLDRRVVDPNEPHYGKLPLVWCIESSNRPIEDKLQLAKTLIDGGAYTCGKYSESSPLYSAIRRESIPMIKLLVENGADFIIQDGLIHAIEKIKYKIIEELLKLGADLNTPNSKFEYPIMCAARIMNIPMVRYLIEKGVDLNKKNSRKETALSISLGNNDFRTFKLLVESGADTKLADAAIVGKMKTKPMLVAYMAERRKVERENARINLCEFSGQDEDPSNES